ncbi:hypothetical protein BDY21DRAFT_217089 [Lineolata rhizophorae]|uniref:Zn(2)-C6 fungal-type domain-containing protein n=1 Tax=Lineolata rhizophorae TaxID=578093 RepID=A0A6A6P3G4_9PEZI|nr:hypothetical protein BDY21DRAFT_217089 [Lineolata rhizophorae]
MPTKRKGAAGDEAAESGPSSPAKKKAASNARTGQACDRCKHRKIRCDDLPEGCASCTEHGLQCYSTDRNTGRVYVRGQFEALESQVSNLKAGLETAAEKIQQLGYKPEDILPGWRELIQSGRSNAVQEADLARKSTTQRQEDGGEVIDAPAIAPIKGTSLALFDLKFDLADFVSHNTDDPQHPMSYEYVVNTAMGIIPTETACELPPDYKTARSLALLYFRHLNSFTPVLEKPQTIHLLHQFYHEPDFKPTTAQTVIIHMMLAHILYQLSQRNQNSGEEMRRDSMNRYKYCLGFFRQLLTNQTVEDMQALTLICVHIRNFPLPGGAWQITQHVFQTAIGLGYHSAPDESEIHDSREKELRKRVFWVLYSILVGMCGKLGRPMPIERDYITIGLLEPVDDTVSGETVRSDFEKCSFRIGNVLIKLLLVMSEIYSSLYAPNRSLQSYEAEVERLDAKLLKWKSEMPQELAGATRGADPYLDVLRALLESWETEVELLLFHPRKLKAQHTRDLDRCLEASSRMLQCLERQTELDCMDATWMSAIIFLGAMLTALYIHEQRKQDMTTSDMNNLQTEMSRWMVVISRAGRYLGTKDKLRDATQHIVNEKLNKIRQHLVQKTASAAVASAGLAQSPSDQERVESLQDEFSPRATANAPEHVKPQSSYAPRDQLGSVSQYSYPQDASSSTTPYSAQNGNFHSPGRYLSEGSTAEAPLRQNAPAMPVEANGNLHYQPTVDGSLWPDWFRNATSGFSSPGFSSHSSAQVGSYRRASHNNGMHVYQNTLIPIGGPPPASAEDGLERGNPAATVAGVDVVGGHAPLAANGQAQVSLDVSGMGTSVPGTMQGWPYNLYESPALQQ